MENSPLPIRAGQRCSAPTLGTMVGGQRASGDGAVTAAAVRQWRIYCQKFRKQSRAKFRVFDGVMNGAMCRARVLDCSRIVAIVG